MSDFDLVGDIVWEQNFHMNGFTLLLHPLCLGLQGSITRSAWLWLIIVGNDVCTNLLTCCLSSSCMDKLVMLGRTCYAWMNEFCMEELVKWLLIGFFVGRSTICKCILQVYVYSWGLGEVVE